jgi:serine/threonine protein kinase
MKTGANEPQQVLADSAGRYLLSERVGRGGVGEIFRAHDTQLNRWVAIKRLRADGVEDGRKTQIAIQEAKNLASLQHPNIVTVFDFIEEHDDVLVVMEYIHGLNLQDIGETRRLDLDSFVQIANQVLDGLAAAHSLGMVHRDLKPSNIMVAEMLGGGLQAKILDFGLAKVISGPTLQTMEFSGSMLGSIYTLSPEQIEQRPMDARSDIYSLGCVFYFCLTGQYPFRGDNIAGIVFAHLQHAVVPLGELRPDVPRGVSELVMRMISQNPDERPQSALEVLAALGRVVRGEVAESPVVERESKVAVPVPMAKVPSKGRPLLAIAIALGMLLAGLAFVMNQPKPSQAEAPVAGAAR